MPELVGVDDGPDRLHQAIGNVEHQDAGHAAFRVVEHRARLAVDQGRHAIGALLLGAAEQPAQEPGDPFRTVGRLAPGLALAAAVTDHDHVGGEDLEQPAQVTAANGVEEPAGYLVTLLARGLEPWLALVHAVPGTGEDLPTVRLGLACDLGDLGVVVAEHLAQQEHGALGRRQAFQQDEEGHGQGIGHFRTLRGVRGRRRSHGVQPARDEWLGQPGAYVGFPPNSRGPQVADGQPGGDGGQVGLGRDDARSLAQHAGQPQEGLLDDVLGVADAPGHPVGDREHQRPVLCDIARVHRQTPLSGSCSRPSAGLGPRPVPFGARLIR